MWAEIEKNLTIFETGVLSVTNRDGYPYSVRCRSLWDRAAGVLRLDLAEGGAIEPGPASLLFHSHNEELWNLKVFLLRGTVEAADGGPVFRPERPVTGTGLSAAARMLVGARKAATAYLKKRGLERPPIPWDEIEAVKEQPPWSL